MRFVERLVLSKSDQAIHVKCPAKVNLFLKVLGKRADGYHEVENVMQTVSLFDELTVQKGGAGLTLICSGEEVGVSTEENLAFRAAELFFKKGYGKGGVRLDLKKNIPVAAGLAGGSSDAACCLLALNELFGSGLSSDDLRSLAAELGSDIPFFVEGGAALCTGRGEVVRLLRSPFRFSGILLAPEAQLKTTEMYSSLTPEDMQGPHVNEMLRSIQSGDLTKVCSGLFNSFERAAFEKVPELARLKTRLEDLGSLGVVLCGSGPTLLGIFPDVGAAKAALHRLRADNKLKMRFAATIETF